MSRNPRTAAPCRPASPAPEEGGGATAVAQRTCPGRSKSTVKSTIPKRGPPPAVPKKLDYKKPQMTKAMAQRLKHTKQLQEEMERKERERAQATAMRRPQRTAAPIGGDARVGRERRPRTATEQGGRCRPSGSREPPPAPCAEPPPPPAAAPCATPSAPCPRERSPQPVPARTHKLAKSMNADIVQAEPLQPGPVDNLIIPPGTIDSEKTTIVSIPQPAPQGHLPSSTLAAGHGPNRSVQIINETLDEQDAAESDLINAKLQDLQNSRRDFILAVTNVSNNSIKLQEADIGNITPIGDISPPDLMSPEPPSPPIIKCPSLEDPYLTVEYGLHHPVVEAAREYMRNRQVGRRLEDEYVSGDEYGDEYLDACVQQEEDDVCGQYTVIPRRREQPYRYEALGIERLERFFDLQNYPPVQSPPPRGPCGPPPGRENINPDLWELEDPWYKEPSVPDLIDWG